MDRRRGEFRFARGIRRPVARYGRRRPGTAPWAPHCWRCSPFGSLDPTVCAVLPDERSSPDPSHSPLSRPLPHSTPRACPPPTCTSPLARLRGSPTHRLPCSRLRPSTLALGGLLRTPYVGHLHCRSGICAGVGGGARKGAGSDTGTPTRAGVCQARRGRTRRRTALWLPRYRAREWRRR